MTSNEIITTLPTPQLSAIAYRKQLELNNNNNSNNLNNNNLNSSPTTPIINSTIKDNQSNSNNEINSSPIKLIIEVEKVIGILDKGKEKELEKELIIKESEDIIMNDDLIPVVVVAAPVVIEEESTNKITNGINHDNIDPTLLSEPIIITETQNKPESQPMISTSSVPLFAASNSDAEVESVIGDIEIGDIEVDEEEENDELSEIEESESEEAPPVASTSAAISPSTSKPKPRKSAPVAVASTSKSTPSKAAVKTGFTSIPLPHYTIKRVKNNSKDNPHILSVNPGVTDADSSRWPTQITKNAGAPSWYDCGPATFTRRDGWKQSLGRELAERLGENKGTAGKPEFFTLEDFPENNKFFLHHSSGSKGNGQDRTDPYLYGSPLAPKFRTVNEYAPHLYWLLTTGPGAPSNCQCKYCTGKKQGDVNKLLGLGGETKRDSMSPVSERAAKKPRLSAPAVMKEKRVLPSPIASTSKSKPRTSEPKPVPKAPSYNGAYTDPNREVDLKGGALHRTSEMVWILLPKPYVDTTGNQPETITHWPAIIMEKKISTISKRIGILEKGSLPQINNEKHFEYVVRLLACADSYTLPESSVITWLAHPQPMDLWTNQALLTASESVRLVWNGKECLRPTLGAARSVFEVMAPFALAMQIAAHIVSSFCLVDRYQLKPAHIQSPPDLNEEEKKAARAHVNFGHFQSLWNGSERIYSGELVRLLAGLDEISKGSIAVSPGALTRSFFIEMTGIYKDSDQNMAMCCGKIYELQDLSLETAVEGGMKMFETGGEASRRNGQVVTGELSTSAIKEGKKPEKQASLLTTILPTPPPGFAFRSLTKQDTEVHFGIESIAGRYHQLPSHLANSPHRVNQILEEQHQKDLARTEESSDDEFPSDVRALILAGLLPANKLYMKAHAWSASRSIAVLNAETIAQREMSAFFEERKVDVTVPSSSSSTKMTE